jgi:pyruvate/2-oxoacid:ferredoxin oxidoreductase beta subunit
MQNYFELAAVFVCPSCGNKSTIESVIESDSSDPEVAARSATSLPLKCAACKNFAPAGTNMSVHGRAISAAEYAAWIEAHQTSLHIHRERKPAN